MGNPLGGLYTDMNASVIGKRPRGRPKTRSVDRIRKDAREL